MTRGAAGPRVEATGWPGPRCRTMSEGGQLSTAQSRTACRPPRGSTSDVKDGAWGASAGTRTVSPPQQHCWQGAVPPVGFGSDRFAAGSGRGVMQDPAALVTPAPRHGLSRDVTRWRQNSSGGRGLSLPWFGGDRFAAGGERARYEAPAAPVTPAPGNRLSRDVTRWRHKPSSQRQRRDGGIPPGLSALGAGPGVPPPPRQPPRTHRAPAGRRGRPGGPAVPPPPGRSRNRRPRGGRRGGPGQDRAPRPPTARSCTSCRGCPGGPPRPGTSGSRRSPRAPRRRVAPAP